MRPATGVMVAKGVMAGLVPATDGMNATLDRIRDLVREGEVRVSQHAAARLRSRALPLSDVLAGVERAVVVEAYEDAFKGPTVLALQSDRDGKPLHVLWALAQGTARPAVLVTAYRPDSADWSHDSMIRRRT